MASQYNNGGSYDQNRGGQGGGYPQHNRYGGEQRNRYGGGGRDNNGGRGGRGGRGGNQGGWEPFQDFNVDNRRERTRIRDDMEKHFKENNITEGSSILDEKMAPGIVSKATEVFHTNAFGVALDKFPVYQYHIEMFAWRDGRTRKKVIFLTKRSNDDYVATDRKTRCRDVFTIMKQIRPDIFHPTITLYYDLQSALMTTAKLKPDTAENQIRIVFDPAKYPTFASLQSFNKIDIVIKQAETDKDLTSNDMTMARLSDLSEFNRAHQRFVELATSQYALFNPEDVLCLAGMDIFVNLEVPIWRHTLSILNAIKKSFHKISSWWFNFTMGPYPIW